MSRLTIRNSDGSVSQPKNLNWAEALEKLAMYEDFFEETKTTPSDLTLFHLITEEIPLARFCEIMEAERNGRLVIIPAPSCDLDADAEKPKSDLEEMVFNDVMKAWQQHRNTEPTNKTEEG